MDIMHLLCFTAFYVYARIFDASYKASPNQVYVGVKEGGLDMYTALTLAFVKFI